MGNRAQYDNVLRVPSTAATPDVGQYPHTTHKRHKDNVPRRWTRFSRDRRSFGRKGLAALRKAGSSNALSPGLSDAGDTAKTTKGTIFSAAAFI